MKNQNSHKSQSVRGKIILLIGILALYSTGCGASSAEPPAIVTEQVLSATAKHPTERPASAAPTRMSLATLTPFDSTDTSTTAKPPIELPTSTLLTLTRKEGWIDFINGYYGYAINLPTAAVATKNDKIDHVQAERPAGMEPGEYFDKLN